MTGYQHFQAQVAAAPAETPDGSAPDERAGDVPSGGGTNGQRRLVLTSTEDAVKHVDFRDLVSAEGGCAIADTARRSISLVQFERVMAHVRRRLVEDQEVWMVWNPDEQKKTRRLTSPDAVNLYDLNDYCIKAGTMERKTSLVECMAQQEQTPDYFVSQ